MKLLVVNNLSSGFGDGAIFDFMRAFAQDGDEIVVRSTNGRTDLADFLSDAHRFDAVVASGGDGTVSAVSYHLANTGVPVLPFPAGTANLLALNLHSPTEPHSLAKMARRMETLDFDVGEIELPDKKRFGFSIIAGAGYDATIMKEAVANKRLLGPLAYFSAAFANPTPQHSAIKLEIDGNTIESDGIAVLIVNFARIQFDIAVVHENLPRDGSFDVAILHSKDAWGLIPLFLTSLLDRTGDFPDRPDTLEVYRGKEISVLADPPLEIQYDGEAAGITTPFTVRVIEGGARFIVSDECLKVYQ